MEGGQYDFNEIQRRRDRERRARSETQQKKAPTFFSTFFSTTTVPSGANPYKSNAIKSIGIMGSIVQFLFYISTISLVGFLILVMLHFTMFPVFSFLPGSSGMIPITVPTNRQQAFIKSIAPADVSAEFNNILPFQYTVSFDAFVKGDFVTQTAPRILLYNSTNALTMTATDTIDTVAKTGTNIIVYLDSQINDLYVRIMTGATTHIESPAIKNIPLRTPFRVTLMVSSVLLEVYLNGALQQTVPLKNTPPTTTTNSKFFGPPVLVQQAVSVMNISYWDTMLPSASIRMYGTEPFNYLFNTMQ